VTPEWWKLPPLAAAAEWRAIGDVVREHDTTCRGLLVLGAGAGRDRLRAGFAACKQESLGRGFAVGRSIFQRPTQAWLSGRIGDSDLVQEVASGFAATIAIWESA
jgi:5-dehydro-2-deoxygluconokinase